MRGAELNRCAISIAKIFKKLSDIEKKILNTRDLEKHKKEIFFLAYLSRIHILDCIEINPWMSPNLPITIPTGLFSIRKETIASALSISVGKILELSDYDSNIRNIVDDILKKGVTFYEIEKIIPSNSLDELYKI